MNWRMEISALLRVWALSVAGVVVSAVALEAGAQPGEPAQTTTSILRIGTSGDYAPFSEWVGGSDGSGQFRGFDIEVAKAFARDEGYEIEWIRFTWPRLLADLRGDRFDIAMSGVTVRVERSAAGRFSVPVVNTGAVLLYRPSAKLGEVSPSSVPEAVARFNRPEIRIAVNRGGHLERVARAHFPDAVVEAIADNDGVRRALAEGRVDAVMTDTLEAPRWAEGIEQVATVGPITRDRKAYWAAANRRDLSRKLDTWLLAREADGRLAGWRREHLGLGPDSVTARPLESLLAATDERLALMPWVAETKRVSGKAVEDRQREKLVIAAARRNVEEHSKRLRRSLPDAESVDGFYTAQISAAKAIQRNVLAGKPEFEAPESDLVEVLRPALIRIGDRMAQLVVALVEEKGREIDRARIEAEVTRALNRELLGPSEIEALTDSIAALLRPHSKSGPEAIPSMP